MNTERTMQFILDNLASVTARQEKAEIRADRMDRQIKGLQTLVKTGMNMLVRLERGQKTLQEKVTDVASALEELTAAQKRTDQRFDRWLDSVGKSTNGKKRPH